MPKVSRFVLLYVTTASRAEAAEIAVHLLEQHLIACANILGPIRSHYRWKGVLEHTTEFLLLCKTTQARIPAAKNMILKLHSYECPCITVIPITDGHAPFLDWIRDSVR